MICSTTGQEFYDAITSGDVNCAIAIVRAQKSWFNLPILSEIFSSPINIVYDVVVNESKFNGTLLSIILRYYDYVRYSELILDEILKVNSSLEYISKDTPLTLAIRYAPNHAKVLIPKLCAHGANVDGYPDRISPLIAAIRSQCRNRIGIIKDLIDMGANINGLPGKDIPLHEAIKYEDIAVVNLLLQVGAEVNAISNLRLFDHYALPSPKNALWYALKNIYEKTSAQYSYKILKILLLNGADPNQHSMYISDMLNHTEQISMVLSDNQILFISGVLEKMIIEHTCAGTLHKLSKLYASDAPTFLLGQCQSNLIDLKQLFNAVKIKLRFDISRMLQRLNLAVKIDDLEHPPWAMCPISHCIMVEPVQLSDTGHIFDKSEIQKWLKVRRSDPLTGSMLRDTTLHNAAEVHERIFTYLKRLVPLSQNTRPTKKVRFG